jgi:hypothetical protein
MKRKLAILLAVVMLVTMLPTQVFANTGTVSLAGAVQTGFETGTIFTVAATRDTMGGNQLASHIPALARNLVFHDPTTLDGSWEVEITLTNATWVNPANGGNRLGVPGLWGTSWELMGPSLGSGDPTNNNFLLRHGAYTAGTPAVLGIMGLSHPNVVAALTNYGVDQNDEVPVNRRNPAYWDGDQSGAGWEILGVGGATAWGAHWLDAPSALVPAAVARTNDAAGVATGHPDLVAILNPLRAHSFTGSGTGGYWVRQPEAAVAGILTPDGITFEVNPLLPANTGVLTGFGPVGGSIAVPVVARVTNQDNNVSVRTSVGRPAGDADLRPLPTWNGTFEVARAGDVVGGTVAEIQGRATGRFTFDIDRLIIRETRPNTFARLAGSTPEIGRFYVEAPAGFEFTDRGEILAVGFSTDPTIAAVTSRNNRSVIAVDLPADSQMPLGVLRSIAIEGISLLSVGTDMGDFSLRLLNSSATDTRRSANITQQTINAGTRAEFGLLFERATPARDASMTMPAIPNLFAGRFDLSRERLSTQGTGDWLDSSATGRLVEENFTSSAWGEVADNDLFLNFALGVDSDIYFDALSHRVARVRFEETIPNSWVSTRDTVFTLPQGVSFLRVDIVRSVGLENFDDATDARFFNSFTDIQRYDTAANQDFVVVSDNEMRWVNWERTDVPAADVPLLEVEMDIWVSVSPTFAPADGSQVDIELSLTGGAAGDMEPVVIATAQRPIVVTTSVTDASIGFQRVPVSDVVIRETQPGVLRQDLRVQFGLAQPPTGATGADLIAFHSGTLAVTGGDIEIDILPNLNQSRRFDVVEPSTEVSEITLSNVAVHLDRTLAWTEVPYNVNLGGNALIRNGTAFADSTAETRRRTGFFGINNFGTPFINIATPPAEPLQSEVRVAAGRLTMTIDGVESQTFDAAAFNHDGTMMIPIRFISYALGLTADDIIWANGVGGAGGTVSIIGPNNRTVRFQVGSSEMLINGGPVTMADAMGRPVEAMNVNDRVFIPFRQIGNAFNVPVEWDAEAGEAIFNRR